MASLMGKLTTIIPIVDEALFYICYLQRNLSKTLVQSWHNWEPSFYWPNQAREEILWWQQFLILKNGLPIRKLHIRARAIAIHTDSSEIRRGMSPPLMKNYGFWAEEEVFHQHKRANCHFFFGLQLHGPKFQNKAWRYLRTTQRPLITQQNQEVVPLPFFRRLPWIFRESATSITWWWRMWKQTGYKEKPYYCMNNLSQSGSSRAYSTIEVR